MTDALREALQRLERLAVPGMYPEFALFLPILRTALQEPAPAVAREPTPKMMLAGATALYGEEEARDQACRDAAADCWYAMYNAAPQAPVEPAPVVQPLEGHDGPCYYCGEPCNSLAGNPRLWPVALCHADEPGKVKWHHTGCVESRLSAAPSQLVEDARRYRWLRDGPIARKGLHRADLIYLQHHHGPELDAAIDKAMSIAKGVES